MRVSITIPSFPIVCPGAHPMSGRPSSRGYRTGQRANQDQRPLQCYKYSCIQYGTFCAPCNGSTIHALIFPVSLSVCLPASPMHAHTHVLHGESKSKTRQGRGTQLKKVGGLGRSAGRFDVPLERRLSLLSRALIQPPLPHEARLIGAPVDQSAAAELPKPAISPVITHPPVPVPSALYTSILAGEKPRSRAIADVVQI